jgi:hypothetical protein
MPKLAVTVHRLDDSRPYSTVTVVPNPGRRYEAGRRIIATLKKMDPGSDESFLVESRETAHHVAKQEGFEIRTRKEGGGKFRVWRLG